MANCLFTKLKESVNADIVKLGSGRFPVSSIFKIGAEDYSIGYEFGGGNGNIEGNTSGRISSYTWKEVSGTTGHVDIQKYTTQRLLLPKLIIKSSSGIDSNKLEFIQELTTTFALNLQSDFFNYDGILNQQGYSVVGTVNDLANYTKVKGLNFVAISGNANWDNGIIEVALTMPAVEQLQTLKSWDAITIQRDSSLPVLTVRKASGQYPNMSAAKADEYLNVMAQCAKGTRHFLIDLRERTSASDAAVATLTAKGYSVRVGQ